MRRDWRICVKRRKNGSDYGSSFVVTLSYEKSWIPPWNIHTKFIYRWSNVYYLNYIMLKGKSLVNFKKIITK